MSQKNGVGEKGSKKPDIEDTKNRPIIGDAKRVVFECLCCSGTYYTEVKDKRKNFDAWVIEKRED